MRHYEIVFILHPDHGNQLMVMLSNYRKIIENDGGNVHRLEDWGLRQLAYSIASLHKAHYILMNIECSVIVISKLDKLLKNNDAVLRRLVIKKKRAIVNPSFMMIGDNNKEKSLL